MGKQNVDIKNIFQLNGLSNKSPHNLLIILSQNGLYILKVPIKIESSLGVKSNFVLFIITNFGNEHHINHHQRQRELCGSLHDTSQASLRLLNQISHPHDNVLVISLNQSSVIENSSIVIFFHQ